MQIIQEERLTKPETRMADSRLRDLRFGKPRFFGERSRSFDLVVRKEGKPRSEIDMGLAV